jgi:signal transduction histidine kinase
MAGEMAVSLGSAFLAALVFHPARRRIQEFVDRSFFRQSYDYKKSILSFNETLRHVLGQEEMIGVFNDNVKSLIPVERLAIVVYSIAPEGTRLVLFSGSQGGRPLPLQLCLASDKVWARRGATNTEEQVDVSLSEALKELEYEVVIPLPFKSGALAGAAAAGKKKSGARWSGDDIELLATMTGELASGLERVRLQEEVIYERASKEKLDELNRLKTEFVSTVSHELRTPMSSIQGLTEILQDGKIKDKAKREEMVALLASESGRLSRLVHNILDFGKIEQQAKTYRFERTEVRPLVEEAIQVFRHKLEEAGFDVRQDYPPAPVFLSIDRDSVKQVLINLIDNAIKYSAERKTIAISLVESEREVEIRVSDQGIGIPGSDLDKIFDKFYRSTGAAGINPKGVGLGLKIAGHIMAAHHGEIGVESRPGEGSTFRLVFPKA